VRVEFDLSASDIVTDNGISLVPGLEETPILLPASSENGLKTSLVQLRFSVMRDEFDLRTSNNLKAPSVPM
jgi:hypothetical protein